jgi:hypothetical protein
VNRVLYCISAVMIIFSACESKGKFENIPVDHISIELPSIRPAYAGRWIKNDQMFYGAELELTSDGHYTYSEGSCLSSGTSKGTWQEVNGEIVLQSDEEFKSKNNNHFDKNTGLTTWVGHDRKIDLDEMKLGRIGDTLYKISPSRELPRCFYQLTEYKYIKEYRPSGVELPTAHSLPLFQSEP